jgi:hypothetical protein
MARLESSAGTHLHCPLCNVEVWVTDPDASGACTGDTHSTRTILMQKGRSERSNSQEKARGTA